MAEITLGAKPKTLRVYLVAGADFVPGVRASLNGVEVPWEVGTEIKLVFDDPAATTWTATIDGAVAQFNEDKAEVDALLAASPKRAKLWYINGPLEIVWADGEVVPL